MLAQKAHTLASWQWFDGVGITRNRDERKLLAPILLGLYLAHKAGKTLYKTEVCRLPKLDRAVTGPKYIALLAELNLVEIQVRPQVDRRKDFVVPTERLLRLVEM